jgi:hypothetical protein
MWANVDIGILMAADVIFKRYRRKKTRGTE